MCEVVAGMMGSMADVNPTSTASSPPPALELRDVHLHRDGTDVIGKIDSRVEQDQRWVILGANGSGKTSLMRIMALYDHPTSGTVDVLGQRLGRTDVRTLRRRVGYASAALADQLRPQLSVIDVVQTAKFAALEPWWHRYDDADADRARFCLAQMGVERFADRTFGTLSSGEQQRVLLARTLMNEPAVVLLDEPSARLDLGGREELVRTLGALATDAAAPPLVIVTHHVDEIPPGITHVLLLAGGNELTSGPIDSTLTAESLSECFGLPLDLDRRVSGRFSAWARH
jgi:iron complex transport system ATP-binding protein